MPPRVLFLITSDPRTSPRPAEAIRIAAGVAAWRGGEVRLHLHGPAVLALGEGAEELTDGQQFARYLPQLCEWGRPVYVQRGAPELADLGQPLAPFEVIDTGALARLIIHSKHVLRF